MPNDAPLQHELPLPFPELTGDQPLLPARMINEYVYCPRLAYLEWVQGEWADSHDTVEGRHRHQRVDQPAGELPPPEELEETERIHARSLTLSAPRLGLIAKMDLIESDDGRVVPVDYKKGKRPHVARGAYEPERVQLCVQGLILEETGYDCREGVLYYCESRERVPVVFDEELRNLTLSAIHGLRGVALGGRIPPPLEDSPKCPRCSLVGICLPDEVNFLRRGETPPRPIAVGLTEALPLYVQAHKAKVAKAGETLEITVDDSLVAKPRINEVSQLVLQGNVYVTTPTLHELMSREIPVVWTSYGGWFLGYTAGFGHKNVELRIAQYRGADDERVCLQLAKGWVRAKIHNARTLLRRNWRGESSPESITDRLEHNLRAASRAQSLSELLGIEGTAAATYFGAFAQMLKRDDSASFSFDFTQRTRRPPADPVNALLSYAYALLVRAWTVALVTTGFDPYRGFYHQPRYGRPALALDMMEPFRPLIAESCVIQAINNGEIRPTDFIGGAGRVNLTEEGRKRFIATFERRMGHEITHPLFGYKISYRRLLEVQARLLGRFLLGELTENPNFTTR
ncbi:CRISP-associated protein Cas1 [Fontimonas thermophila]|uniref:CRISPR-associated endonuclease Cas1 n=1 Tax=Fontimonas thermophila TaxID=1076937 RepID=A0A1I2KC42_9GAMM|nr:CRISPR-associated endonuclease Cas4/Cas1 [Fontimonas thermophila]SFF64544.1 CRISP-associated protein Cas1 [Fontimonas thermophila]